MRGDDRRRPATGRGTRRRWRAEATLVAVIAFLIATAGTVEGASRLDPARSAAELRPHIVRHLIPFGPKRVRQMRAYSLRHYGDETELLTDPKVIVEHYTTSHQLMDAWWYFADNVPVRGELPGACSHFLIDTDGTIHQVMPLTIRCRHATGLNDVAIGIEDVGVSDLEIMRNPRMMDASLRLTLWLMARFGIVVRDVIGHAEILRSPWHHELVPAFQCMRHDDWRPRHMDVYRRMLRKRARQAGVTVGPPPEWITPDC